MGTICSGYAAWLGPMALVGVVGHVLVRPKWRLVAVGVLSLVNTNSKVAPMGSRKCGNMEEEEEKFDFSKSEICI